MDGYFLRDEDIIGDNPGEYKTFDLVDWKVSPTTDFSLESADLNFTTENLLDRVAGEDDTLADSWLSVLNTKESWSETKTKSLQEGYLNEQVVPDQGQGEDQLNQETKSVPTQEIQSNFTEISTDSLKKGNTFNSIHISNNLIMDNALKGATTPENLNNSMLIVDHKEQVKSEQEGLELPPANIFFTFNAICEQKNVEKTTKNNINEVTSTEAVKCSIGESLSNSAQATLVSEEDNNFKIQSSEESTSESAQPASCKTNIELKLKIKETEQQAKEQNSKENEIFIIRKRILNLLTTTKIQKCMMVNYKFDSNNELPSFAETFCPNLPEEQSRRPSEIELPEVLKITEDNGDRMFIVLPDTDSESQSSDIEQDDDDLDKNDKPELKSVQSTSLSSEDTPKIKIESEVMETETEIPNKAQKVDTPSSLLAIDDELEKYLVSSIMLNGTSQNSTSQLPDLSNNIGSLLTTEEMSEEPSMELVYGNLFSKSESPVHGKRTCKQEESSGLKMTESINNCQGNLLNTALMGSEKPWQDHDSQNNVNTLYSNVWTRSAPNEGYVNQVSSRHFTVNDALHVNDPFMSNTNFKSMPALPAEIMQTDLDPFKFNNLVPKVEVVDSSLNYGF